MTSVGAVVLSMGDRPAELARGLRSLLSQREVVLDVVVVGNGWEPAGLPATVRSVALPDNVGVPAGRNVGAAAVSGDILLFFDDDLEFEGDDVIRRAVAEFDADPALAVLQPRSVGPAGERSARRHVPRLRTGDPTRSGDVVWFWEGCSFVRRSAFAAAGGWAASFWYGHEGIELAWRVIDAGCRVHYDADLAVRNPPATPFRRPDHQFLNCRNRVWVARRNLPHPLLEIYVVVWMLGTFARARSAAAVAAAAKGFLAGAREPAGERRPISWRAAVRMTRLGRPPIV
jgi:GT2 family glycosyltransferase